MRKPRLDGIPDDVLDQVSPEFIAQVDASIERNMPAMTELARLDREGERIVNKTLMRDYEHNEFLDVCDTCKNWKISFEEEPCCSCIFIPPSNYEPSDEGGQEGEG